MSGQVPKAVKEERARLAAGAAARMEQSYLKQWTKVTVLFEEERDGFWRGHTTRYCEVRVRSGENLHNQLRQVTVTGIEGSALIGRICEA